ncbi:MAG: RagB/SusD family nutrient uptake outer membrane protein [Chitinophagaceae bacterium]|nr:RagB/SusD family nutrient uptake outer membrane protein [Chitinophagaceae bacterium]
MKKCYLYIIAAGLLTMGSCKKYLDKEPDNRTNIKTPEQVAQLLTSAYPKGNYILFTESMSDNAEDKQGGGSGLDFIDRINAQSYRYQVVEESPDADDGPDFYWNACYKAIAAANQALEIISNAEDSTVLSAHKGEALLARAYAHFMLVTLFAKVYDPATAASDPGVPYVTVPEKEVFKQYQRNTVASVYDMIEKDLLEGYPLINDQIYGNAPKFHFNRKAAAAFAARFYMFKQDFEKVITYATAALGNSAEESLRPWNTVLTDLQYFQLQAEYTKSTTRGNLLLQEAPSVWGRSYPDIRYGLGDQVVTEIFLTNNVTGTSYAYDIYGANPQVYNIPKFYEHFVREDINANTGIAYNTIPLLTGEEALLNRAEAYLRTGNANSAAQDLNIFISQNMDDYDPFVNKVTPSRCGSFYGTSSQTGVLLAILDFKRAFFIHEGMRWFDILRLHIPVTHVTSSGEVFELLPDDNRRVLQLPALTKQAGLEPNPR